MEVDAMMAALGRALRELREREGISQEQLGLATGVHRNYIGGIERGERSPTVAVVLRLCSEFDTTPSALWLRAEELARSGA
jgi:transcriptional regulator with XRE-family HTH domain